MISPNTINTTTSHVSKSGNAIDDNSHTSGSNKRTASVALKPPSDSEGFRKKRQKTPSDAPKRPLSAYNHFFRIERARLIDEIQKKHTGTGEAHIDFRLLAKDIGKNWQALSFIDRSPYQDLANKDTERYNEEKRVYELKVVKDIRKAEVALAEQQRAGGAKNANKVINTISTSNKDASNFSSQVTLDDSPTPRAMKEPPVIMNPEIAAAVIQVLKACQEEESRLVAARQVSKSKDIALAKILCQLAGSRTQELESLGSYKVQDKFYNQMSSANNGGGKMQESGFQREINSLCHAVCDLLAGNCVTNIAG